MSQESCAERDVAMKAIRNDLLEWTCERHAGDHPLEKCLLRDKSLKLAGKRGLAGSTGFKCPESWLTCSLKGHDVFLESKDHFGSSSFDNCQVWIDTMIRSIMKRYKHKDLFHLDELTMYSDISPIGISSTCLNGSDDVPDPILKKVTILMCCNASGTEKLPLLICGSYPAAITNEGYVYSHSEDASINDTLFRNWLIHVNDRMSGCNRNILLLLHGDRGDAFRGLELSNVKHVFFPDAFSPLPRPLRRDVFVKMIHRSKYVEGIKESLEKHRWNAENVVKSLTEAWQKVPRNLIIASIQRTSFEIDDYFLKIHCDAWQDLKIGRSFKKFVTFDDKLLTANSPYEQYKSTDGTHEHRLGTTRIITLINNHFDRIDLKENERINGYTRVSVNLRGIYLTRHIDWQRKSSLKRSYDKAELNENSNQETNNAEPNDDSTSLNNSTSSNNEDVVGVPSPAKLLKIGDVRAQHENATCKACKAYKRIYSTRGIAALVAPERSVDYDWRLNEIIVNNNEKRCKNSRCYKFRSFESQVDIMSHSDIALRQAHVPRDRLDSMDWNENVIRRSRKSLKRRRSRSDNSAESRNNLSDDSEPERKRLHFDSNWTERYETMFVFGSSDFIRTLSTISANILNGSAAQRPRLRRSCETERSIFTIRPRRD